MRVRVWEKGVCCLTDMGGRAEDFDIDVLFLIFLCLLMVILLSLVRLEWGGIKGGGGGFLF